MISQYLEWIALGMLVLVVAAIAYLIYQYAIKDKALDEVVTTAEMAKRRLNPADRREVFGYREDKGLAGTAQSKTTIEQVLKSREKMRPQWEHTYNDKDAQDMDEVEAEVRKASI